MASPLLSLNKTQWEDLCDRCGRCCLVKLQDDETDEVVYTNVACEFFNQSTCKCRDYQNRSQIKPSCVVLSSDNPAVLEETLKHMPFTCAYRLEHEDRTIQQSASELSVSGKVVSETYIHDDQLPEHIVDWISVESEG